MSKKDIVLSAITVVISVAIVTVAVSAATGGLLTPPSGAFDAGVPVGTMHTLEDIYIKTQPCNATTDTTTGLMWQNDPGVAIPWADASGRSTTPPDYPATGAGYCDKLTACGVTWRLPTKDELVAGLTNQFVTSPATLGGFQDGSDYWSSTPNAVNPGNAWVAYGGSGHVHSYNDLMSTQYLVRCVH